MSVFDALRLASDRLEQAEQNKKYMYDIRSWARDKLGYHLWNRQVEIADALVKYRRVAVKSGHGVGKSFVASIIMAWFIDTRRDLDSIAISTAPSQPQLDIIWEYLRDHHRKGNMFGRITLDNDYKSELDVLRARGRKPANTNEHAFQGIHRRNGVLAIIDESCGVPESLFTGVDVITTGKHDYCLAIGNPDDINTPFGQIWTQDKKSWHKITISSYDSPNLTGEDFPEDARGGLVSEQWIEERAEEWGRDSARFKSKVLGEFSESSVNALFSQTTLAKGIDTELEIAEGTRPRLGVDVARFGDDYTAVYSYHCGVVRLVEKWSKTDLVETSDRIHSIASRLDASEVRIDGVGIGAGVYDMVSALARKHDADYKVVGMIGNAASPDLDKWANARAWWYDTMRERMFRGQLDIDYADKVLKAELEGIQYKFNSRGATQIESKDDMKKRKVKSPDFADAAMYACADLPIDPDHPLSAVPMGEEFQLGLEEFLAAEERMISPY